MKQAPRPIFVHEVHCPQCDWVHPEWGWGPAWEKHRIEVHGK